MYMTVDQLFQFVIATCAIVTVVLNIKAKK